MKIQLCLLLLLSVVVNGQTAQEPVTLEPGKPLARKVTSEQDEQRDVYKVALKTGEFLHVVTSKHNVSIMIGIFDPGGQRLIVMNTPQGASGSTEAAAVIAETSGDYRVEVRADRAIDGRYEISLAALRPATDRDRIWMAGQKAYSEGQVLRRSNKAEALPQAVEKYQEAIRHWRAAGDPIMEIHALLCLGRTHRSAQVGKALEAYEQALTTIATSRPDSRDEAVLLLETSGALHELGELTRARLSAEKHLALSRAIGNVEGEGNAHNTLGFILSDIGDLGQALEQQKLALVIRQKLGNRLDEARVLYGLAQINIKMSAYQSAMEYAQQSLVLFRTLRDRFGEANVINTIGFINGRIGEWRRAVEYYRQAIDVFQATGSVHHEAVTRSNLAIALAALDQPREALEQFRHSLRLYQESGVLLNTEWALSGLGRLQVRLGDMTGALESLEKSLQVAQQIGRRDEEQASLYFLGDWHLTRGDDARAQDYVNRSLALAQSLRDRRGEARARYGLAQLAYRRGDHQEARRQLELALALIESLRSDAGSQQMRISFQSSRQQYHELYVETLMQLHRTGAATERHDALALQANERARARALLEMLTESRANIRAGVDAALLNRERELTQLLNARATREMQLRSQRGKEMQLQELSREINALEDEYQQLQGRIRQSSPHYAALTQPQPLNLAGIQQLLDADTLLLEYALGEKRSYLWAVTNKELVSYELPARDEINQAARQVTDLLNARNVRSRTELPSQRSARIAKADAELPAAIRRLSQIVIAPAAAQFGNKRLLIVADGALQYVPFAALTRHADKPAAPPLVAEHEIVTLPSASTLAVMRRELAGRTPAPKGLAVIADPVFAANDERLKTIKLADKAAAQPETMVATRIIEHFASGDTTTADGKFAIPRLPFTRREADRILALAPTKENWQAMDFKANRAAAVNSDLSQYRYVHFATHGLLDAERPSLSALALSLVDEQGKAQDGFLRAHEIYNLKLPAELVVLSACQTGLGKEYKGEGLVGLTRGFMYAGAARVVVSLWSVSDRATSELMAKFYQKIWKGGQRPAAALRATQVEMWKQKQWQAPYYWAAFVLQGEWK